MQKPTIKPNHPFFSSGPCSKRPGWKLEALNDAVLGRSHRAKSGKAKLNEVIVKSKQVLELPDDYDINEFSELICECWSKTRFGYNQVRIIPVRDDGWLRYQLKTRSKSSDVLSSIDWDNIHFPTLTE